MVELILDHRVAGKIDQTQGFLVLTGKQTATSEKYEATNKWVQSLETLWEPKATASSKHPYRM